MTPDWLPTAENINALPEPVRRYIHDLETRCDPAGEVRAIAVLRQNVQALDLPLDQIEIEKAKFRGHELTLVHEEPKRIYNLYSF